MRTLKQLFFMTLLVSLFVSCRKEHLEIQYNQDFKMDGLRVEETRLHFTNREMLNNYLNNAKNISSHKFESSIKEMQSHEGFISLKIFNQKDLIEKEKINKIVNLGLINRNFENNIDIDEDPIVSDDFFASLLNSEREIIVGDTLFRITNNGTFFTSDKSAYEALKSISEDVRNIPGLSKGLIEVQDNIFQFIPENWLPEESRGPYENVYKPFYDDPKPNQTCSCEDNIDHVRDALEVVNYDDGGIIESIFGPSHEVNTLFENDQNKRVKTKTWNENFYIFASTGLKVKYQEKKCPDYLLGICVWDKTNVDAKKLTLGYQFAEFKYNISTEILNQATNVFHLKYNDYILDFSSGSPINPTLKHPKNLFKGFPIQQDFDFIEIYLPSTFAELLGVNEIELTTQNLNDYVKNLANQAYHQLGTFLNEQFGDKPIVFVQNDVNHGKLIFSYYNWEESKCNENKISNVLAWVTGEIQLATNFNNSTNITYGGINTFSNFKILCYGLGMIDNCTYAGAKLYLAE